MVAAAVVAAAVVAAVRVERVERVAEVANIHLQSLDRLRAQAKQHGSILVAFSGGKDSLAVLDLCRQTFERVVCFFMYLVPGLKCVEKQLQAARERYGVEILQYPHWLLLKLVKDEIYRPTGFEFDGLPQSKVKDVYLMAMADTGINLVASGAKKSDYATRATIMRSMEGIGVIHPLAEWTKFDLLAYLKVRNIPLPESSGRATTGIDLSTPSLLWLYDNYPEDFEKLCEGFPYAKAAIYRREFFGVA